ncbi:hypothetical protein LCGC14_1663190 [marine sediment metagenome]|uniref:Uncharacterized protein n=1 Tax=marine sediment metagenome TaxID=412755 RepID=A0A0F9HU80_9ZZZZ
MAERRVIPITRDILRLQKMVRDAEEGLTEVVRFLAKVVPAGQDDMIRWAVKSQDSVYTNAGAAFRTGLKELEELRRRMAPRGLFRP